MNIFKPFQRLFEKREQNTSNLNGKSQFTNVQFLEDITPHKL